MSDAPDETEDKAAPHERSSRFRRLGRRFLGEQPEGEPGEKRNTLLGDAKEAFGAVLESSDKAKSEVVRAVAREVRNYLEESGLKEDVHNLLTNYSLEVHASVNLRKLAESDKVPKGGKE
jgi:hypothetical protein